MQYQKEAAGKDNDATVGLLALASACEKQALPAEAAAVECVVVEEATAAPFA